MVMYNLLMEVQLIGVVLKSTTMVHGILSVMITGLAMMQQLYADSWVILDIPQFTHQLILDKEVEEFY